MSTPSFEGKPFQVGDPGHGGPRTDSAPRRQGRAATGNRCGDGDLPRPRQDDAWRRGCRRADFGPALTDSAACLVAAEHGPDRQFERLLAGAGRIASAAKPILEVNPRHQLIIALAGLSPDARSFKDGGASPVRRSARPRRRAPGRRTGLLRPPGTGDGARAGDGLTAMARQLAALERQRTARIESCQLRPDIACLTVGMNSVCRYPVCYPGSLAAFADVI